MNYSEFLLNICPVVENLKEQLLCELLWIPVKYTSLIFYSFISFWLQGTRADFKNEMLFKEFGINYNTLPPIFRKGSYIFRRKVLCMYIVIHSSLSILVCMCINLSIFLTGRAFFFFVSGCRCWSSYKEVQICADHWTWRHYWWRILGSKFPHSWSLRKTLPSIYRMMTCQFISINRILDHVLLMLSVSSSTVISR